MHYRLIYGFHMTGNRDGPQDLVTVSLYIKIAIDKIKLYSMSVAYACPYHNPIATMGYSVHNVDISKPLAHTTRGLWL
jgi:hypothetical protein